MASHLKNRDGTCGDSIMIYTWGHTLVPESQQNEV